jgi:hypothetical protein
MLRHACGFKLANDGHDTRALQHYLGHKHPAHGSIHRAFAHPLPGLLEGLIGTHAVAPRCPSKANPPKTTRSFDYVVRALLAEEHLCAAVQVQDVSVWKRAGRGDPLGFDTAGATTVSSVPRGGGGTRCAKQATRRRTSSI